MFDDIYEIIDDIPSHIINMEDFEFTNNEIQKSVNTDIEENCF